jgi:hypothetical protein
LGKQQTCFRRLQAWTLRSCILKSTQAMPDEPGELLVGEPAKWHKMIVDNNIEIT